MYSVPRQMIANALDQAELDEDALYEGYSGRGMFGEKCFGIVGNMTTFARFIVGIAAQDYEGAEMAQLLADAVSSDNMGYDSIYYFPSYTIED
ncbi:hypothetical protein [Streptomyces sp. NPDC093261]|uniref:hypothetical protein n=1 Tax=Streptomyces sp. NPDC093261 TaxID=3366037 RepID=UPI00380CB62C